MRSTACIAFCASVLTLCAISVPAQAQATLSNEFRPLLVAQYAAIVRGDTAALRQQLADDLVWVIGVNGAELTKSQLIGSAAQPQVPAPRFEVDSVRARRMEDVAIVEYRRVDHRRIGTGELVTTWRALDVFARRRNRWLLEQHTQTWLVTPVRSVPLDSVALQAFVGRYQIAPGYVDNVHWEGKQLTATASGQTLGAKLVPVSSSAFSPDGMGSLIVFERDATGRVLGYVQGFPDGSFFRAARLP